MKQNTTKILLFFLLPLCALGSAAQKRVLVYTRSYTSDGKGYVHNNIAASVEGLQQICRKLGLAVDASDDPAVFTKTNLSRYSVIVFSNSNNEAFTSGSERAAFKAYIEKGGGFVGIHSASGSERTWDWFATMIGGRFITHPKLQHFEVRVSDKNFLATQGLPVSFTVDDECYFIQLFAEDPHVILTTDRTKLDLAGFKADASEFANPLPLAWWHEFDGGREFYIALGHDPSNYSDAQFTGILERAIRWAASPK